MLMSPQNSTPGTPSRDGSTSPILTPRSKVKAMIAAMESDDDDDDDDDDDNDVDEEATRPRGKLASRVRPRESDLMTTKESAYERVRESLLASKEEKKTWDNIQKKEKENLEVDGDDDGDDNDDDDDDIPVPTLRRKRISKALFNPGFPASSDRSTESPRPSPKSTSPLPSDHGEAEDESDDELPPENLMKNPKFMALVERKRKERQEAEAERERLEKEKRVKRSQLNAQLGCGLANDEEEEEDDDDDDDDDEDGGHMTQKAPRRKAGKRALEEMHKESQRLARSMHLEHQVQTRKKITKQSLFDKFNFRTPKSSAIKEDASKANPPPADSSSVIVGSETEKVPRSSPISSPPSEVIGEGFPQSERMGIDKDMLITTRPDKGKGKARAISEGIENEGAVGPILDKGKGKAVQTRSSTLDKGKGKAVEKIPPKVKLVLPPIKITVQRELPRTGSDSDSDLEILHPGHEDKVANSERQKMVEQLRGVRRVKPPVGAQEKPKLTAHGLQVDLLRKSRLQAAQEREERIEELKAKGIIVLTAEERAREQKQVDDLLGKAREEALAIREGEKRDKKAQKGENSKKGGIVIEAEEDEDDDWLEEEMVEISGSEDEEEIEGEGGEEEEEGSESNKSHDFSDEDEEEKEDGQGGITEDGSNSPGFITLSSMYPQKGDSISPTPWLSEMPAAYIDAEADEDSDESNGDFAPFKSLKRKEQRRKSRIVEEDDEMEIEQASESRIPSIFRNKAAHLALPGLTQLFDATGPPANVEMSATPDVAEGKADALRKDPGEGIPNPPALLNFGEDDRLDIHFTQDGYQLPVGETSFPTLDLHYEPSTQMSAFPDPTQDQGFVKSSSPAPPRFGPTQDEDPSSTILIPDSQPGRKRGRLMRRGTDLEEVEEEDEQEQPKEGMEKPMETAFDIMKKAAKKAKQPDSFDKSKSAAKEMIHEQAEESEDEYAGVGGASDDEGADGHDSEFEEMIDDENRETVDRSTIAAFYADEEKARDERDVSKLFKDLQTGLFRKKRGANFDLDDSDEDDDGEARRRAKRRQMAKLRKTLMADGNIEKLASNPKKLAFLSAIEDRDRDDEMDFLDKGEEDLFIDLELLDSQSRSQSRDSRDMSMAMEAKDNGDEEDIPGSQQSNGGSDRSVTLSSRRTNRPKKPSLAEVRETLSFLIEEDDSQTIGLSDSDGEGTEVVMIQKQRTTAVIDRVAVARSNNSTSESTRMAFQTTETQFRVPGLLRRSTTGMSSTSGDSQGSSGNHTVGSNGSVQSESAGVKRGGKASSSINFHQREQLRARVENDRELKRKQERKKQGQQRQSVLEILTKGNFS